MMVWQRRGLQVLMAAMLMAVASLPLAAQTGPLNPLVTRTPQRGTVPPECAEGVAPAPVPRVDVAEIPLLPPVVEPAELPAPPTGSLRDALEETQKALTRNDRPAFDASLASARELLEDYPSGAQRRSAEELMRIYDATARLWDAQYESPFLSESSSDAAQLRGYPGYEDAVRRSTLTRDGQRWFPAGESRDFLGRVAAERLRGIGIQAPAPRLTRNETPSRPSPSSSTSTSSASSVTRRPPRVPRTPVTTSARATARPPRSAAPSRPRLAAPAPASAPSAPPSAAAVPPPADVPAPEPEPTVTEPATSATPATTASAPATSAPTAATSAEPESAPTAAEPSRTRSVVLPTILILIGLGVLILLFRASK